jgi:hypothetical protein
VTPSVTLSESDSARTSPVGSSAVVLELDLYGKVRLAFLGDLCIFSGRTGPKPIDELLPRAEAFEVTPHSHSSAR